MNKDFSKNFKGLMEMREVKALTEPNIFQRIEAENREKFSKVELSIPKYLKPFKKQIKEIAFKAFVAGTNDGKTIKFRRPTNYGDL